MTCLVKSQSMPNLSTGISVEKYPEKIGEVTHSQATLASGRSVRTTQCPLSLLWDKACAFFARCFPCINRNREIAQVAPHNVDQQLAGLRLKSENLEKNLKAQDHYINRNLDRIFKLEKALEQLKLEDHKHAVKLGEAHAQSINIVPKNSVDASTQTGEYELRREMSDRSISTTASEPQQLAIIDGGQIVATQDSTMVVVNRQQSGGNDSVKALGPAPRQLAIEGAPQQLAIIDGGQIVATQDGTMVAINRQQSGGNDSVKALGPAPQQLAIEGAPRQLAIGGAPQQLAIEGAPQQLAIEGAPRQLAIGGAPQQLAIEGAPQQLAIEGAPRQLAIGGAPQQLAIEGAPQQLAVEGAPRQLAIGGAPRQLAIEGTPRQLTIEGAPRQLAIEGAPRQLAIEGTPRQLAIEGAPRQLAIEGTPRQLAIEGAPRQLAIEGTPRQLAIEAGESTDGPQQLPGSPWDLVRPTGAERLRVAQAAAKKVLGNPEAAPEERKAAQDAVMQADREKKVAHKVRAGRQRNRIGNTAIQLLKKNGN